MKKKAELFTTDRLIEILENMGNEFGYKVDNDTDYNIEDTATISYLGDDNKLYLSIVVLYGGIYTKINIFDQNDQNIFSKSVRAANFDINEYRDVLDKTFQELGKNVKFLLNTPEKIYDYGEENNWQGLEQKHYEILSQDKSLAQMAVADMQDKGLKIPDILKQFRRYSMSFKEILLSKIAKEKHMTKKMNKKAAWSDAEKKQVGALDDNAVGKFNIYQDKAGEIFVTKHKLNDNFVLMDTAETFDDVQEKIEKDWQDTATYVGYDKELLNDKSIWQFADYEGNENGIVDLSKDYATEKKAAEEDLDVKLKVQKNKPVGLDTSSPKSLPESIRPLMQDLKGKISDVKEIETQLAARKAELDAKYQEAKNESKIVEKQAEIENLTNNIGKLLFAAKNETFQFQDNLVALTHQTKTVPAKATDKWKFEKVFAKLQELMGNDNAQKFLDATLNGLQSQATEKTITELNIFSPTQKQMKTSDTSDTNSFIDALKEIYTNLRSYFIDVKKANNILEEQLATGATASKKQVVSKKAESSYKDKIYDAIDMGGEKWVADALVKWISEDDAKRFCEIYELIDVESKKKVKVVKKAEVGKKAENMVTMELPLANYMEMLKDRAKEIGRSLYMADELEDYFLAVGGNVLEPMTFVDNYLINGEFVEKEEFTAEGNYSELYEEYNGNWEEMCENAAIFYNDEMACLNLGF